jgi:hypothetical protein
MIGLLFLLASIVLLVAGGFTGVSFIVLGVNVPLTLLGTVLLFITLASWLDGLIRFIGPVGFSVLMILIGVAIGAGLVSLGLSGQLLPRVVSGNQTWGIG